MRIALVSDAWTPQVHGVVRTLASTVAELRRLGHAVETITPDGFATVPGDRESGLKLVRRSMAHLARERLGERDWVEGQIMLGHRKGSTSDTYAPFSTGYLARALEVTDHNISEIEKRAPGACRLGTQPV